MRRAYFLVPAPLSAAFAACLALGIVFSAIAQTGTPPPAGTASTLPSANQSQGQPSPAPAPDTGRYVLESQVPLVVLDVVVTDKDSHPVHGLKASAFTVLEKGRPMTVQSFEEHRFDQAPPPAPRPTKLNLGPNVFTNITYTPNNGPLNILLMDALNTPRSDQAYVRQQMLEYLKKLPEGTRIAIFGLSTRLFILQGFTTDPAVLKAVLSGKKALGSTSPLLTTPEEAEEQQEQIDNMGAMGNDPGTAQMQADMQQFQAETATFQTTLRVQYTLSAMNDLARYLSGLPGRKNLIWFSGSFPINILPDGDLENPFGAMANYEDDVKATADLLTRSQVAVYPVDGRGLFVNPAMTASVSGASMARNPQAGMKANTKFFTQTASEHFTMQAMAEQTGGKAFYNTNGLKEAVQEAIDQGSNYYTLTYTPTDRKWDGGYRNIRVKTDQADVNLFYRHGYYAQDPNTPGRGQKVLPMSAMQTAMLRGGPDPTEILFKVRIVPTAESEKTLPPANQPVGKKMKPPYRHYTIVYVADFRHVTFTTTPDGIYHGSVEYTTLVYSPEGEVMNAASNKAILNVPAAKYESMMRNGVGLHQQIGAPAKGEYFLRIGLRDITSDRVGALEVPLTAIQPVPAPAPAAGK